MNAPDAVPALRRGLILSTLYQQAGLPLTAGLLEVHMAAVYVGEANMLRLDLDYLIEAGMVVRREKDLRGQKVASYKLTPLGYRTVERSHVDPGVQIPAGS